MINLLRGFGLTSQAIQFFRRFERTSVATICYCSGWKAAAALALTIDLVMPLTVTRSRKAKPR
jgi:hypothetical protein